MKITYTYLLDRVLDPVGRGLTPEAAREILKVRLDAKTQARVDRRARKCNEGKLTAPERAEHESCVRAIDLVAILQAKARDLRKRAGPS
jgi:hypothetical protein